MLSIWLGSAAAILLLVGVVYLAQRNSKKEQKEELLIEERNKVQEKQCCDGHCDNECNCQHELEEEHECCGHCGEGCNCEEMLEEESVMHLMEEEVREEFSEMVYINEGISSSNKFHARPDAHNMDGAIAMSRSDAERLGFVPCGKCFKK